MSRAACRALAVLSFALSGCGSDASGPEPSDSRPAVLLELYATEIVSFEPGEGAGFGQEELPDIVLGPPTGKGTGAGSLDVLSLGKGGSIVLGFEQAIVDGEGPDLIVFENAFWAGGDPQAVFAEPGEVSVSADGELWKSFECDETREGYPGCAGVTPALEYDAAATVELDPLLTGGDAFDLGELGLAWVRFVRLRDVSNAGAAPTAGFDLDAIGVVYPEPEAP